MTEVIDISDLIQTDMDPDNSGDQLLWEDKFPSSFNFSYTFLSSLPDYYGSSSDQIEIDNSSKDTYFGTGTYASLDTPEKAIVTAVLETKTGVHYRVSFSDVVGNMAFTEQPHTGDNISDSGDITFGKADRVTGTDAAIEYSREDADDGSNTTDKSGIVFDKDVLDTYQSTNNWAISLVLHEIGHSLGLGHSDFLTGNAAYLDSAKYTVMSYSTFDNQFASNLQLLDIIALQEKYGYKDYATRLGTTNYKLEKTGTVYI